MLAKRSFIAFILSVLLLILSLTACGQNLSTTQETTTPIDTEITEQVPTPPRESEASTEASAEEPLQPLPVTELSVAEHLEDVFRPLGSNDSNLFAKMLSKNALFQKKITPTAKLGIGGAPFGQKSPAFAP